jgi:hypothetical protein
MLQVPPNDPNSSVEGAYGPPVLFRQQQLAFPTPCGLSDVSRPLPIDGKM